MAFHAESIVDATVMRRTDAWVWPMTAAIVMGGSILFWSFVGLFWLATHPTQQSVVIWTTPAAIHAEQLQNANGPSAAVALENRPDARTN